MVMPTTYVINECQFVLRSECETVYKYNRSPYGFINSLWPSDTIWRQISGSTLAQVMGCCWRHPAITWTNVDLSSVKFSDIHIRAISQEMPRPSITKICLKITCLKLHSNFPGTKELTEWGQLQEMNVKFLLTFFPDTMFSAVNLFGTSCFYIGCY